MIKDLKAFLLRGNVVDLAIAVVVGAAFGAIVTSFTNDVLMQLIAGIFGKADFSQLTFTIGEGVIRYGSFFTAIINFVIIGTAMFFVVKGYELLTKKGEETPEVKEVELLAEIRDLLRDRTP